LSADPDTTAETPTDTTAEEHPSTANATAEEHAPTADATAEKHAASTPALDPEAESVLSALQATDIDETPPVELMAKVQQWQEQLAETEFSDH
jgi:DNA mismatch repair protein MutS